MLPLNPKRIRICLALAFACIGTVAASDGAGSVYPAGVETVMPGLMPASGGTLLAEFTNFYEANALAGPNGVAAVPGFHLRVAAVAGKVVHNWGIHLLGGELVSTAALPYAEAHLTVPGAQGDKAGFSNAILEPALIAYTRGNLHWWYGMDVDTPGLSYSKTALVNIGQHNYATAPVAAFTWMPDDGRNELSSRLQYIVNYTNPATDYRSGNEFLWEFDGMRNVGKVVAFGFNGYYYQQTTGDTVNGALYLDGYRGRTVQFGPEIRCHFKRYVMGIKYEKDFLTENRPVGNSFWAQFGIPLWGHHDEQ